MEVLRTGDIRLGWLVDGDPTTEKIAVMLMHKGSHIELEIPISDIFDLQDPYARWFSFGFQNGVIPNKADFAYTPPQVLLFESSHGSIGLVGCRSLRTSTNLYLGTGTLQVKYAVIGAKDLSSEHFQAMRCNIAALSQWTSLSSRMLNFDKTEAGKVQSIALKLESTESLPIASAYGVTMQNSWSIRDSGRLFKAEEWVQVEVRLQGEGPWYSELWKLRRVADLLSIAAGEPIEISNIAILEGQPGGDNSTEATNSWLPVIAPGFGIADESLESERHYRFLFHYRDLQEWSISRWFELVSVYPDALLPLINLTRTPHLWDSGHFVQSAICIEALGFEISRSQSTFKPNRYGGINFPDALRAVIEGMKVPPFDASEEWVDSASERYKHFKHADHTSPTSIELLNATRENIQLLRYWIANQLGVAPSVLTANMKTDPLQAKWVNS